MIFMNDLFAPTNETPPFEYTLIVPKGAHPTEHKPLIKLHCI